MPGDQNYSACGFWNHNSGKTATVRAISDIWGGACDLDYTQEWGELSKRIMSSDDAFSRIMLFDNVKGTTFGTGTLEAAITAKTICGWKAYVGQVSRPNDATFVVTFNDPALTRDLTDRAVVIKIGTQRHQFDFVTWAYEFVQTHRAQLLADCLGMLRAEPQWKAGGGMVADRFQVWQRNVLAKVPGSENLAKLIMDRRVDVDADFDAAAGLMDALSEWVGGARPVGYSPTEIDGISIHGLMVARQIFMDDKNTAHSQNIGNAIKRAKRILSGRNILTPLKDGDGNNVRRTVMIDSIRTTTVVFSINAEVLGAREDPDIPF